MNRRHVLALLPLPLLPVDGDAADPQPLDSCPLAMAIAFSLSCPARVEVYHFHAGWTEAHLPPHHPERALRLPLPDGGLALVLVVEPSDRIDLEVWRMLVQCRVAAGRAEGCDPEEIRAAVLALHHETFGRAPAGCWAPAAEARRLALEVLDAEA